MSTKYVERLGSSCWGRCSIAVFRTTPWCHDGYNVVLLLSCCMFCRQIWGPFLTIPTISLKLPAVYHIYTRPYQNGTCRYCRIYLAVRSIWIRNLSIHVRSTGMNSDWSCVHAFNSVWGGIRQYSPQISQACKWLFWGSGKQVDLCIVLAVKNALILHALSALTFTNVPYVSPYP